jgi:uncharacterized protein YjbJ (UPF0337 family)
LQVATTTGRPAPVHGIQQPTSREKKPFGRNLATALPLAFRVQQEVRQMDWNRVEGNWKQVKGKVKEQWGKLTDDDLDRIAGKRDQLEGKIQERYGLEKDRVRRDIDDWYDRQGW